MVLLERVHELVDVSLFAHQPMTNAFPKERRYGVAHASVLEGNYPFSRHMLCLDGASFVAKL
jgi:hypothetical protein